MIVNGNYRVRGTIQADSLLFKEMVDLSDMTRGINISLINGKLYYKVDDDNTFTQYSNEDIDNYISDLQTQIDNIPTGGGSTEISNYVYESSDDVYNLNRLLNNTFFPMIDGTTVYLTNMNFDNTSDILTATLLFDKIQTSTYKNGKLGKFEYQTAPSFYLNKYYNEELLPTFHCFKFENRAFTAIDQSRLDDLYLKNLLEFDSVDVTLMLNALLIDNSNDETLSNTFDTILQNSFFTLNWFNFKLDSANVKNTISDLHMKAFDNTESLTYFIENYVTFYNYEGISRIKKYFIDYKFFVQYSCTSIIDYLINTYNYPEDFTNNLSTSIINQKIDNSIDLTDYQPKDYSSFEQRTSIDEIVGLILGIDSDYMYKFVDKINQSDLSIQVKIHQQNITSLNNPLIEDLDLSNTQTFDYFGGSELQPIINKMNLYGGEFQIPLIEIDLPIESIFQFTT